jgi:hypothetical protein
MDAAVQTFSIHKRDVRRGQGLEEEDFIVGRVGAVGGGTPQMQARGWGELVARAHSDEDQDEENLLTRTRQTKRVYSHDTPPPFQKGRGSRGFRGRSHSPRRYLHAKESMPSRGPDADYLQEEESSIKDSRRAGLGRRGTLPRGREVKKKSLT